MMHSEESEIIDISSVDDARSVSVCSIRDTGRSDDRKEIQKNR